VNPPAGRTRSCQAADARARLLDVEAFLVAAERVVDLGGDVVATNAVHAAIAAADAICCLRLGERSRDADHRAAVTLLARVDRDLAAALDRVLAVKTRAGYEARDVSAIDAGRCVRLATRLRDAAREAIALGL